MLEIIREDNLQVLLSKEDDVFLIDVIVQINGRIKNFFFDVRDDNERDRVIVVCQCLQAL